MAADKTSVQFRFIEHGRHGVECDYSLLRCPALVFLLLENLNIWFPRVYTLLILPFLQVQILSLSLINLLPHSYSFTHFYLDIVKSFNLMLFHVISSAFNL